MTNSAKRILFVDEVTSYEFLRVALQFENGIFSDVFARKNNKTLGQTLAHRRYAGLEELVLPRYAPCSTTPLGSFLIDLKRKGDGIYRRFLNKYGDLAYSKFGEIWGHNT
jgi:hypothetical protein